tara:strand:- start:1836 stop:2783 length:948 start_codon:yes stop_codon:yes gene_type:complete
MEFSKPKIIVSKCLEFDACRYDGQLIKNKFIKNLKKFIDFIPVCPEVEIGMGIPRDSIRIIKNNRERLLFQPETGNDFSKKMDSFSKNFLNNLTDIDGFILKTNSPSCGVFSAKIYPKKFNSPPDSKGAGFFAEQILSLYPNHPIEEEKRLNNIFIREHFYTSIFTIADFKNVKNFNTLYSFHSKHKYLFMSYNQTLLTKMGDIAANRSKNKFPDVLKKYKNLLLILFTKKSRYPTNINTQMHVMGYFKDYLTSKEKKHFLNIIEEYRNKKLPISAVNGVLVSWINRFENKYLMNQSFFNPFPKEIIEKEQSRFQ